ncbi:MAG: hypothetical protein GY784_12265 [Gammaproteobacteria bacterium]|nr:hypothetical protein [Gammaproteobacteria bacterium]
MWHDTEHLDDKWLHKPRFFTREQAIPFGLFIFIATLYLSNSLEFLEFRFLDLQFQINERASSQGMVIVEIDPISIK